MEFEEIENSIKNSIKTVKDFSEYVKRSRRSYGLAWAVWGILVFVGFGLMHLSLYIVPWYLIAYLGILGTFAAAFLAKGFISCKISEKIGRARSWIDVISDRVWLLALLGGVCFCFIPFIIVNSINTELLMCTILLGWFIADGIGSGVTGIITDSKGAILIGIFSILAVVPLSLSARLLEYAFLIFGIIIGGGNAIIGFYDYNVWLKERGENISESK